MRPAFADTFYWIAPTNPGDRYYQKALSFDDLLAGGKVHTTKEVLSEVLTFFAADSWLRNRVVETVREILSDDAARIIPQSHESFLSGFDLYAGRPDKGYSLERSRSACEYSAQSLVCAWVFAISRKKSCGV